MSDLPDSWEVRALGELNQFSSGTLNPATRPEEIFELYSVPSFPTGTPERLLGSAIGSTKQTVAPGDVLISKINPRINRVWTVGPKSSEPQIASSEWIGFRSAAVQPAFANYYFKSPDFREVLCSEVAGVGGSLTRAQPKRVTEYTMPIAPAAEQTRIANQLDTLLTRVQACNDRLDAIPALLKRFRQTVLDAALNGSLTEEWRHHVGSNKDSWSSANIGELITEIQAGLNVTCEERPPLETEKGLVKISAVTWGRFDEDQSKTLPASSSVSERVRIQQGDFLISRANTVELVGACVIVGKFHRNLYLSDKVLRLVVEEPLKPWLLFCLRSRPGRQQIESLASGNQLSMRNLSQASLKGIVIPMPPFNEQAEIVHRVEALFALADRIEVRCTAARTQAQRLTPLVLAKAFRGELVPQDPNDEPASALLARIASANTAAAGKNKRKVPVVRMERAQAAINL